MPGPTDTSVLVAPDWGKGSYQPHWADDAALGPSLWDTVFLGELPLPGRAKVSCPLRRAVEEKKAKGKCGGTITDNGEEITPVDIDLEIVEPEEWQLWQDIMPQLWVRKKGGKRYPLKIEHPKTAMCGITEVYIKSIEIGDPENGVMHVKISCSEWLIAPKDAPKPAASKQEHKPAEIEEYSYFNNPSGKQPANVDDIIGGTAPPGAAAPW